MGITIKLNLGNKISPTKPEVEKPDAIKPQVQVQTAALSKVQVQVSDAIILILY